MAARFAPADLACLGGLALGQGLSWALLPFVPALLAHHADVVELLTGSTTSLVAAGAAVRVHQLVAPVALLAGFAGMFWYHPLVWWAGRRYGNGVLTRMVRTPRAQRRVARAEELFRRWGVWALVVQYYLPVPNSLLQLAAGTSGMSLRRFVLADAAGTLLWELPALGLGFGLGASAEHVVTGLSGYSTDAGLVLAAVVVAVALSRARGRGRGRRLARSEDA